MTQYPSRRIDPLAVKRIKEEMDSLKFATELRIKQAQERENCLLCLAGAFLRLRHSYGLTWEEIAQRVDGIADRGHAHKIARREAGLSRITYQLAIKSVNSIFLDNNDTIINFPDYPITSRRGNK
jgi:hypothetical protein